MTIEILHHQIRLSFIAEVDRILFDPPPAANILPPWQSDVLVAALLVEPSVLRRDTMRKG